MLNPNPRSLLRCSLSSLFPDDSGTLGEELLYDSIVEHVASVYTIRALNWISLGYAARRTTHNIYVIDKPQ